MYDYIKEPIDQWIQKVGYIALQRLRAWKNYPSPAWIGYYGMAYFQLKDSVHPVYKPQSEWKALREKVVNDFAKENHL